MSWPRVNTWQLQFNTELFINICSLLLTHLKLSSTLLPVTSLINDLESHQHSSSIKLMRLPPKCVSESWFPSLPRRKRTATKLFVCNILLSFLLSFFGGFVCAHSEYPRCLGTTSSLVLGESHLTVLGSEPRPPAKHVLRPPVTSPHH